MRFGRTTETYRAPWDASQSLVSVQADVQRVSSATPLLGWYIGFTIVVRADGWAAVNDLHNDRVADTSNASSTVAAAVGDLIAGSAVTFWACGTLVTCNDTLAIALGRVGCGVAKSSRDIW